MDDEILMTACKNHPLPLVTYGSTPNALIVGELSHLDPFVHFSWHNHSYHSPILHTHLVGKYNFNNFLAAIAFGNIFDVPVEQINEAIEGYIPQNNRSQVTKTVNNTLIIDCYNANPSSMKSALESFNEIKAMEKLAIIGDMLELGEESFAEHQTILDYCKQNNIPFFTIGPIFKALHPSGFENHEEFRVNAVKLNLKNQLILLKGSRGIALEKLIDLF